MDSDARRRFIEKPAAAWQKTGGGGVRRRGLIPH